MWECEWVNKPALMTNPVIHGRLLCSECHRMCRVEGGGPFVRRKLPPEQSDQKVVGIQWTSVLRQRPEWKVRPYTCTNTMQNKKGGLQSNTLPGFATCERPSPSGSAPLRLGTNLRFSEFQTEMSKNKLNILRRSIGGTKNMHRKEPHKAHHTKETDAYSLAYDGPLASSTNDKALIQTQLCRAIPKAYVDRLLQQQNTVPEIEGKQQAPRSTESTALQLLLRVS